MKLKLVIYQIEKKMN